MSKKNIYREPECIVTMMQATEVLCESTNLNPWEEETGTIIWLDA